MVQGSGHLAVLGGSTTLSEEPVFSDESEGKLERSGVDASQRLSFLLCRKTFRGKPRSERYSGNPTVADRRGACGNVDHGGIRHPPRLLKERVLETLHLKLRAPKFYPDPSYPAHEETYHKATRLVPTQRECVAFRGGNHPFGSHRCQPLPSFFGLAWHEECSSGCGWSRRFVGLSHGWIQHDGQPKAHKSLLSCIPILDITCDAEDRLLPLPALQVVDQVG